YDKNELCSSDQIICIKDVTVKLEDWRDATLNFKVQYASVWSANNNATLHGVFSNAGYTYELHCLYPLFES
ncbi:hypothetical protein A0J61_11189, partial [Choanephora cucurbitarum]